MNRELSQHLVSLRRNHPAWLLLASRNGPLTLACLKSLLDAQPGGVDFAEAVEELASSFALYANDTEFRLGDDHALAARRELRQWMKRGLIVEREGQLLATDALESALNFLDTLEDRAMTSTASRLATVQRAIEDLQSQLTVNQTNREETLKAQIAALEQELAAVQRGDFEVLSGAKAQEGIREVYQLAVSLRADFRRVEDSYRDADRDLRQRILSEKHHRGEVVEELLAGHEALVQTAEGQVFESFHEQLVQSAELERMKQRLSVILQNDEADRALERKQKGDLRRLVRRLVQESERVIQARARSERDVRHFLQSGLADEQIRVGAMLQEIFQVALDVDWQSQKVRRKPGPLPPVAVSAPQLPLVERLLAKEAIGGDDEVDLDFSVSEADPANMDEEFWNAYRSLDRARLFESTVERLQAAGEPLTIADLARELPPDQDPSHDLETLAFWLAMAREAGIEIIDDNRQQIDLFCDNEGWTRFYAPRAELSAAAVDTLESGKLE